MRPDTNAAPLVDILKGMIRDGGPLSVADYVSTALYHPAWGYYVAGKPVGAEGDFITAPEISQMFGELIGLWCLQSWRDMGSPPDLRLVELGPGRGTLMQDALRAMSQDPVFLEAAQICLVEKNHYLKTCQAEALQDVGGVQWYSDLTSVPHGPFILIANEFFDCLPVRQFAFQNGAWHERMIGLDGDGTLRFELSPRVTKSTELPVRHNAPSDGDILETSAASLVLSAEITARLGQSAGRALIIDYGHDGSGFGDTLQAVKHHAFAQVLETPGQADLTAHVDFAALRKAAEEGGGIADGPVSQGNFLESLGLNTRSDSLKANAAPSVASSIDRAARRLSHPDEMGTLFKALCLSSPDLPPPAGFPVTKGATH